MTPTLICWTTDQPNRPLSSPIAALRCGSLSYVRLGMEVLRDKHLAPLVRRTVRWLGLYLWTLTPIWLPRHLRYRRKHWWPVPY